ncbi:hypothetical protein GOP47_0025544 [Adiantum capillus-veneris]|uniref:Dof-type domain-containing protein n=1 Tax=Adiantum capillus-veneris TaxID=13818 RepID=A0A9D4U0S0_ADICA|nr:hypothetical protein GOP47_0025544 [Adiantum capillus-veneris]
MIGQGVYMRSSSPAPVAPCPGPLIDLSNIASASEILAFCSSSFNIDQPPSTPAAPPASQLASGEPRRLAKAPHPPHILKCPRCTSSDTKFCYYNNYSLSQPRYFCKNCKRYWTAGGVLRNVPVGGGLRKNKRSKLKFAAEAEAAALVSRDESTQHQHHEGKPPSPAQVASPSAMGSSITTVNSSVVSGLPANFAAPNLLPSHRPTVVHLPRTSSGSECSTIDYASNESCAASMGLGAAEPRLLQHFYDGAGLCRAHPQFYASYGMSSLGTSCNQPYSASSREEAGAKSRYNAGGYIDASCSQSLIGMEAVAGSNCDNGNVSTSDRVMMMGSNANHASIKGEKEDIASSISSYEWQFISENLFNGDGLMHASGGSWPDFSQFHDSSGPG